MEDNTYNYTSNSLFGVNNQYIQDLNSQNISFNTKNIQVTYNDQTIIVIFLNRLEIKDLKLKKY